MTDRLSGLLVYIISHRLVVDDALLSHKNLCASVFSDWLPGGACAKGTEKGAVVERVVDVLLREDHLFRHHASLADGIPVFKVLRKEVALEKGHLVVVQFVEHVINIAQLNDVCV